MSLEISSKQKTVQQMAVLIDSDSYIIDKTLLYCNYLNEDNQIVFKNILDNYNDYFENSDSLEKVDVDKRFYYQPAAFAEFYYGTAALDYLVLYFAKMTTLFEFTKPRITVLKKSKLIEFNNLLLKYNNQVKDSYKNPQKFL